ncbi:MAG: Hsp70 family protein [Kofleriaceae bacterium]|nr:Hsp70 family protein [Kofleriaceae bacterium]
MKPVIGIDLGTTFSLTAVLQAGRPQVLANAVGELLTPSAVSIDDDDTVLVGAPARARATTHPARTATAFKRDMGTDRKYTLGGRTFTPQELSALVLGSLKKDAEAALGMEIEEAVVTVPAYFGDAQRQATRDAGAIAGLKVERIINEPTAAALAYGLHERHREMRAVVIDLGGGTFDVTVLEILEGVVEIQSSSGDTKLGGEDFDYAIAELIAKEIETKQKVNVRDEPKAWARLKEAAEQAKKRLTDLESTRVALYDLPLPDKRTVHLEMPLGRGQVDACWAPLLERLKGPINRALRDASLSPSQIDEVLLVGGSTRMPIIAKVMAQHFGRLPLRTLPPDEAIAMGAAVQAGLKAGDAALGDMIVTDVAPFSLGVGSAKKMGRQIVSGLFSPILERGTVIPASREEIFATIEDGQSAITFDVYQGEHSLVRDNKKLGEYTIEGLEPLPAGEHKFRVRFTYDLNGILEVDMTPMKTNKTETLVIEGAPGRLTKKQLEEARAAMSRLKFHPRDALPNATLLARADALFVELTGNDRDDLGHALGQFRLALESQDDKMIGSYRDQLTMAVNRLRR